jgi:ABC-type transport system involved in multi-copper enzyme maturation permease subunit
MSTPTPLQAGATADAKADAKTAAKIDAKIDARADARFWHAVVCPTLAVAGFQLGRLLSRQRLLLAALGVVFPAAVMLAVRRTAAEGLDRDLAVTMIYALVPEAVCMLGLLVTMCPAVADELERGTWIHVAVRPGGRRALLVGTYLAAVIWTSTVAILAALLALLVARVPQPLPLFCMLSTLVVVSTLGRAALFALPAVIMPKRALVASVAVGLLVEYLAGFIPAVINQATVSLRLRSLLVAWMGWRQRLPVEMQLLIDPQPVWVQIAAVVILAAVLLLVAVKILDYRQFPPSEEI